MRLRISEKVVGLKLDEFEGGMIGERKGSRESDEENLERMRSILSLKIGGMNWQVIYLFIYLLKLHQTSDYNNKLNKKSKS